VFCTREEALEWLSSEWGLLPFFYAKLYGLLFS
jgi:hypothetical protein